MLGEQETGLGDGTLDVIGVDRTWALLRYADMDRYSGSVSVRIATADVASGDQKAPCPIPGVPAPRAGAFAITDRGIPAWLAGDRLLALNRCGPVELDHGGTIANLSASGATVAWTHDGSPRTAALAW